ncbi:WS/DGAT domain-containing protein [Saccharomonospora sp. NPDC006951]
MVTTTGSTEPRRPERLLIVSADMGEGHNATGRALREAAENLWPGIEVHWVDVLETMGSATGPAFRRIYATCVEKLPWLYDFFYSSMWHHRWFATAAKRVIGAWSGRGLAPLLDRIRPDLVLSTYPMGSTGLQWLRRRRGFSVPTAAWISDFAPHPSWVHEGVDFNFVMHEVALAPARDSVPGAEVRVSAPPVPSAFRPSDRAAARASTGLGAAKRVAVISCGSLGFGRGDDTVRELLAGDPGLTVVVAAGRNERLHAVLTGAFAGDARVKVLGWVGDMPGLMAAADVVVTNAGGATALEALACGRAVVLHNPIAGHGRTNANLMAEAGLAIVCAGPGELAAVMRPGRAGELRALEAAAGRHAGRLRLAEGLSTLAGVPTKARDRPLPSADALFLHAETPEAPQYVGTVLMFSAGPRITTRHVAGMISAVPGIGGRLTGAGVLHGARWSGRELTDAAALVDEVSTENLTEAVDEFFSSPLGCGRLGAARLVAGLPGGRRAVLVALHHALGDGMTVLQALLSDTDTSAGVTWATRPVTAVGGSGFRPEPRKLASGLWRLATAGGAPESPLDGALADAERRHTLLRLRGRRVRAKARALEVSVAELLTAVFAESLHEVFGFPGHTRFRLMVPWSLRGTGSLRTAGNHTGAVSMDLPTGPMELAERAARVAATMRGRIEAGVPEAAHGVVRLLGALPPPLRPMAARGVYRGTWFNAIGTVMPGPRRKVTWHGAVLTEAYPVLAVAPGTGLAWGAMTWGEGITLCFTGPPALGPVIERIAKHTDAVFAEPADGQ